MIHRPSGSDTDRLLRCTFPYGREIDEREPSEGAAFGLESHADYAARLERSFAPRKGRQPPMREDTPAKQRAAAAHAEFWTWWKALGRESFQNYIPATASGPQPKLVEVESSYAWDTRPDSASPVRRVPPPDPRTHEYRDVKPYEFPMTLDFGAVFMSGLNEYTAVVSDYKTGMYIPETPAKAGQLLSQALAFGTFHGARRAIIGFVWAPEGSEPNVITDIVHMPFLTGSFAPQLTKAFARIGDGSLRPWAPTDGGEDYCKYCKTRDQCPVAARDLIVDAADALGMEVARRSELVINASMKSEVIPREELGRIIKQRSAIEKLNKQLSPMIQADIEANGPAVYDGKVYTVETTKPFDSISIRSIKDALGEVKAEKEIARLKKLGCVEERTMTRIQARNE